MLNGTGKTTILIIILSLILTSVISAQNLSLTAELENNEIWLGDSVQLTLYLQGSEQKIAPELYIPGVSIEALGGSVRSSSSVTNINGKVTRDVRKAYIYGYSLKPKSTGRVSIPSIEVNVEGTLLRTQVVELIVKEPQSVDDFKLELAFSKNRVFLNEECNLKISFLYRESLRSLSLSIPELEGLNYQSLPGSGSDERYEINLNGDTVIFSRDDSTGYSGLSAILVIRPEDEGFISFGNSTASFESVSGYQQVQDFFGRVQNQEVYSRNVIPSNKAGIQVLPFPEAGKPDDFFGLSGNISLDIQVEPSEVHIGDPVTLNLTVKNMNNTNIDIPSLSEFLGNGVDIPNTRSSAKVNGNSKTITQTIRISDAELKQIPAVTFSFFNTETETYDFAASQAVPIRVLETRIVTSDELEGVDKTDKIERKITLENKREGLYYNYSGSQLLNSEKILSYRLKDSILIKILLILPPFLFIVILIFTRLLPQIKLRLEAIADRSRAVSKLKRGIKHIPCDNAINFLTVFNQQLEAFLKQHGFDEDSEKLKEAVDIINSVLYGRNLISVEEALKTAYRAVELLEIKEGRK